MISIALQSGSSGNCIYVETGDTRLLFDAGISGRQAEQRLKWRGRDIRECDALILSHDHSDHTSGAGTFHRKFSLPIYMTKGAYRMVRHQIGKLRSEPKWFSPGDTLEINDVRVQTIPTPHDGVETVCFVVEHAGKRLGIFTDLGSPFLGLAEAIASVNGAYLESNYDVAMLANGPYADALKRRISGPAGHLSNAEAADLVRGFATARLDWLVLAHLSEENNTPEIALDTHRVRMPRQLPLSVASRERVGEVLEV